MLVAYGAVVIGRVSLSLTLTVGYLTMGYCVGSDRRID